MIVALIIYLLGVIATISLIFYREWKSSYKVVEITIADIVIAFVFGLLSWIPFFGLLIEEYGHITVFRIKKHEKE